MSESKIGKCYWCVSFDELADGEFFCNRYNEIILEEDTTSNREEFILNSKALDKWYKEDVMEANDG